MRSSSCASDARCPTPRCASRTIARGACPTDQVGHILIRGASVTRGYFGDPEATALAIGCRRLGRYRRSWVSCTRARCTSPDAARKSFSSTARITIPTIWRTSRSARRDWISTSWSPRASPSPGSQGEELVVFVLHRGSMQDFLPTAAAVQPPDQRTHGSRGRASHPDQAHSQDHQRQGAAASVGAGLYRRRVRRGTGGAQGAARGARERRLRFPARSSKRACNRSAKRRCRASEST